MTWFLLTAHSCRRRHLPPLKPEPCQYHAAGVRHVQFTPLQDGIWQLQITATSMGRNDPKKSRSSSEVGKEPAAFSRKTPRAFQLGLLHSKGFCYKAVWEKEGINAPKAVMKSTLQSSCSLCYLILILIEVFSHFARGAWILLCVLLPGQPATTCPHGPATTTATAGPAARSGLRLGFTHTLCELPSKTFSLMPSLHPLNVSKLPNPSGILNIKQKGLLKYTQQ